MITYEIKNTETNNSAKLNIDDETVTINFEPNMYGIKTDDVLRNHFINLITSLGLAEALVEKMKELNL